MHSGIFICSRRIDVNDQPKRKPEEVKLVTAPARTLESKGSMSRPNPYTTDWTDMSDLTRREVQNKQTGPK